MPNKITIRYIHSLPDGIYFMTFLNYHTEEKIKEKIRLVTLSGRKFMLNNRWDGNEYAIREFGKKDFRYSWEFYLDSDFDCDSKNETILQIKKQIDDYVPSIIKSVCKVM